MIYGALAYVKEEEQLFQVESIIFSGFIKVRRDDGGKNSFKFDEVEIYNGLTKIDGVGIIYEGDILEYVDKPHIVGLDGETIVLTELDSNLRETRVKYSIKLDNLPKSQIKIIGHISRPSTVMNFNVKIVKIENSERETNYYYACNNKGIKSIDLIKVLFLGSSLIEEDKYTRITLEYDLYTKLVNEGKIVSVSRGELSEYVTRKIYSNQDLTWRDNTYESDTVFDTDADNEDDNGTDNGTEAIIDDNIDIQIDFDGILRNPDNISRCNNDSCYCTGECTNDDSDVQCKKCNDNLSNCDCLNWNGLWN